MEPRIAGFGYEYLQEIEVARMQLLALAGAAPEALYDWSPAKGARSFSAVLIHIAATNISLLHLAGLPDSNASSLYGDSANPGMEQVALMLRKNISLEQTITGKQGVIDFLGKSFDSVQQVFRACGADSLEKSVDFMGQATTVGRLFLRMLAHTHEHMGSAIAYFRSYGLNVPWPDPLRELHIEAAPSTRG